MNIAAYCRVSTEKEDQLNSLETQKKFFTEYAKKTGDNLVKLYADEGISGTKTKTRKAFLQMMSDAEKGYFEKVIVKDISRLARNTVDLLQSVRHLRELGIDTLFLNNNMGYLGEGEFVITILAAMAQQESANMSSRVKFGKRMNAQKGKVPNIVYGYDKTIGDYFNLSINEKEAKIVKQIFSWYIEDGMGALKIAQELNAMGLKTKRNAKWSQNAICRILTNEIYTGRIINGKEEVTNFLTGERKKTDEADWNITERPEFRIIEKSDFEKAQRILHGRHDRFHISHERQSNKFLFSTLIKCKECGWSYRRIVRTYKNTYIRWGCSGRNGKGASSCANATLIDEEELIQVLQNYFSNLLKSKKNVIRSIKKEFQRVYKGKEENEDYENELKKRIAKLHRSREKYMDMYEDDLISREELKQKMGDVHQELEQLENELKMISDHVIKENQLEQILNETFKRIEDITDVHLMTNYQLKQIIEKIEVDKKGNVDIYLRLFKDLGLDETVPINDSYTQGRHGPAGVHKSGAGSPGQDRAEHQQIRAPYPRRHGHPGEISAPRCYLQPGGGIEITKMSGVFSHAAHFRCPRFRRTVPQRKVLLLPRKDGKYPQRRWP